MIDLPTRSDITLLVTTLAFAMFVGYWAGVLTGSWDHRDMPPRYIPIEQLLRDQPGDTMDSVVVVLRAGFVEGCDWAPWTEVRL